MQDISSVGVAIIIGLVYSWMLTLGILAIVPILLGAMLIQMKMLGGIAKHGHAALEDASKVTISPDFGLFVEKLYYNYNSIINNIIICYNYTITTFTSS